MKKNEPTESITDIVMFDGALNLQISGQLIKNYYPNLTVIRGVEHTVSIFLNDF